MSKRHHNDFSSRYDYLSQEEAQAQAMNEIHASVTLELDWIPSATFSVDELDPVALMRHATIVARAYANSLYNNGWINRRYNKYDIEDIASETIVEVYANYETLKGTDLSITLHPFIKQATRRTITAYKAVQARHTVTVTADHIQWLESMSIAQVLVSNDTEYTQRDNTLVDAYRNALNNAQGRTRDTLECIAVQYATSKPLTNQHRQALKRFKINALNEYARLSAQAQTRQDIKRLTKKLRSTAQDDQGPIIKQLEALYNSLDQ